MPFLMMRQHAPRGVCEAVMKLAFPTTIDGGHRRGARGRLLLVVGPSGVGKRPIGAPTWNMRWAWFARSLPRVSRSRRYLNVATPRVQRPNEARRVLQ